MSQKDIQITLQIKSVKIAVDEQMPVMIIWSRGSKKATTKKRLLSDKVHTAVFNEKFQINTQIDMDEDGNPTKPKMSVLTVASDKAHGLLGKADLDLSLFTKDDFNV
jgi:hypothetical protein